MAEDAYVEGSSFEALFLRGGDAPPALRERLKAIGVDLARLEPRYPLPTWEKAVHLARAELFPGQPEAEAWRLLGHRFLDGFLSTLVGKVAGAAMHLLTPRRLLERSPKYMKMGGNASRLEVEASSDTGITFLYSDSVVPGEFMAGCFEGVLRQRGATARSTVTKTAENQYRLVLTWA